MSKLERGSRWQGIKNGVVVTVLGVIRDIDESVVVYRWLTAVDGDVQTRTEREFRKLFKFAIGDYEPRYANSSGRWTVQQRGGTK